MLLKPLSPVTLLCKEKNSNAENNGILVSYLIFNSMIINTLKSRTLRFQDSNGFILVIFIFFTNQNANASRF